MSILNTIVCVAAGGNTGIPNCAFTFKNLKGGFLVPPSFELTEAQLASSATVMAALIAAINNDNPLERIYPLPETVTFTDATEDAVTQTLGYGAPVIVRDGKYNFTQQFIKGGNCVNKALQKFNEGNYKWLGFDSAGVLIGTKSGTSLKGVPLDYFYAQPFRFNDGSNVAIFAYRLSFDPIYINQNVGFVPLDYAELSALNGLQNVNISLAAPRAANVIKVRLTSGCDGTNLYDLYSTELAAVGNFVVTEAGANITITSVVVDANLKAFTITLDATDPDYTVGGPFIVNLAAVSVLTAAGVVGYEGLALTVA